MLSSGKELNILRKTVVSKQKNHQARAKSEVSKESSVLEKCSKRQIKSN